MYQRIERSQEEKSARQTGMVLETVPHRTVSPCKQNTHSSPKATSPAIIIRKKFIEISPHQRSEHIGRTYSYIFFPNIRMLMTGLSKLK
jgi:hypothetical protein